MWLLSKDPIELARLRKLTKETDVKFVACESVSYHTTGNPFLVLHVYEHIVFFFAVWMKWNWYSKNEIFLNGWSAYNSRVVFTPLGENFPKVLKPYSSELALGSGVYAEFIRIYILSYNIIELQICDDEMYTNTVYNTIYGYNTFHKKQLAISIVV